MNSIPNIDSKYQTSSSYLKKSDTAVINAAIIAASFVVLFIQRSCLRSANADNILIGFNVATGNINFIAV